jgi:hypothetical protein
MCNVYCFPLQQWLHERASGLSNTQIACLVGLRLWNFALHNRAFLQWLKNYRVLKKYDEVYRFIYGSWNDEMSSSECIAWKWGGN